MDATGITAESTRDEFLNLLVTQLRYQDPLEPVKQQDFLGQLAQFSTLEGIEKLNSNFADLLKLQELTHGANLLGRTVLYSQDSASTDFEKGVVQAVRLENNGLVLTVNDVSVPIDRIQALLAE